MIARNISVLLISEIVTKVVMFVYTMFTARYLGASGFGEISFAIAFTGIFAILADLGIGTLTTRDVAKNKSLAAKYTNNLISIKLLLSLLTYLLIIVTINIMGYPAETIAIVNIMGVTTIFLSLTQVFDSLFRAYERMEFIAISAAIKAFSTLFGSLIAIFLGLNIVDFALVYLISSALMLTYCLAVFVSRFFKPVPQIDLRFWKFLIVEGWPFGLFSIVAIIATRIDIVMLSMFSTSEAVGWYQAAVSLAVALQFIPSAVINSYFPRLCESYGNNEFLEGLAKQMNRILYALSLLLTIGTFVFAKGVIHFVYGDGFEDSVILLQILSLYLFVTYIPADGIVLNAIHRQKQKFYSGIAMVITNVVLNFIFIPQYGAIGAAATTVASYIVLRFFYVLFVRLYGLDTFSLDASILKITVAGLCVGALFLYVQDQMNLFIGIILCSALYAAVTYAIFLNGTEKGYIRDKTRDYIASAYRTIVALKEDSKYGKSG